tara:strand:- start:186 stop:815 length:630 start_codon:yes stop_codon:yes gene_type:complete
MAKAIEAEFDPSAQVAFVPVEEGTYPAHITELTTKEVNTRAGQAIIVNMSYTLADEAAEVEQPLYEMDGYKHRLDVNGRKIPILKDGDQEYILGTHLPKKKFYDNGFFVFTTTESANKNSRYFKLLESLGIELEENDRGIKKLVLVEDEDVIGLPVYVKLETHSYVTRDTKDLPPHEQETRTVLKAKEVTLWKGGEKISLEELEDDVPF